MPIELFCDGGSRGNPGLAGCGYVLLQNKQEIACGYAFLGEATNNVAEYKGLLNGLVLAHKIGIKNVSVKLDSDLIVKQLNGIYRVKHPALKPLFLEAQQLASTFEDITFSHVRREFNKRADKLANTAMDSRKSEIKIAKALV
jgi:ribonuclease HI